jgi:hypothetical protein
MINQDELSLMDRDELQKKLKAVQSASRPVGLPLDELDDADIDLWEEEAYYVGLATRMVSVRAFEPNLGVLEPDRSIDVRLSDAIAKAPKNAALRALFDRRSELLLLAQQVCELAKKQS